MIVKKQVTRWVNIYPKGVHKELFESETAANNSSNYDLLGAIGCVEVLIEWEEDTE